MDRYTFNQEAFDRATPEQQKLFWDLVGQIVLKHNLAKMTLKPLFLPNEAKKGLETLRKAGYSL